MKAPHRFSLAALLAASFVVPRSQACISEHTTEPLGCSGWSAPLTEIVNDQARVSGRIGPLAPSARFEYAGDRAAFQRVLGKYAALPQAQRILYLQTGFGLEHDFELTITNEGHGFLLFNVGGQIPLEQLKIPDGLEVEALPEVAEPVDPRQKARALAQQKRLRDFIAARKAAQSQR
jgi:hypothetical protein